MDPSATLKLNDMISLRVFFLKDVLTSWTCFLREVYHVLFQMPFGDRQVRSAENADYKVAKKAGP